MAGTALLAMIQLPYFSGRSSSGIGRVAGFSADGICCC